MRVCVGVDGCRGGWIAVWRDANHESTQAAIFADFAILAAGLPEDAIIAVDMPIGLPDRVEGGGRGPEQAVRPGLKGRQSSVFSVPSRAAVYAECGLVIGMAQALAAHQRANAVALLTSNPPRKISFQAFMLFPKIRELDMFLRGEPRRSERIFESHPEHAFAILNGGEPMNSPKKIKGRINHPGMGERRALLAACGIRAGFLESLPPKGAGADDFLDACAMLLIAERIRDGLALPNPSPLRRDSMGLPIAIWA